MISRYSDEVHNFVRENCTKMRDWDLAEECNRRFGTEFTVSKMKSFRSNHGYRNGLNPHLGGEEYWKRQTKWPAEMKNFIIQNTWHVSSQDMADMVKKEFGIEMTARQVKGFRQRHNIRNGLRGWYQKEHEPANKGKTIDEYMTPETAAKVRQTAFKKGHIPKNQVPVGTEVVNAYSDWYRLRKVSMTGKQNERWKFVHRLVWEEHHGPIPKGCCIIFRDGNKMNCDISNLAMVERGELSIMGKKGYFSDNPQVTDIGITLAKLRKAVTNAEKKVKKSE